MPLERWPLESGRFGMVGDGWLGEDMFFAHFSVEGDWGRRSSFKKEHNKMLRSVIKSMVGIF